MIAGLLWAAMAAFFVKGVLGTPPAGVRIETTGPPIVGQEEIRRWVGTLPFRTIPFEDRSMLERVRVAHPWIESLSEKKIPGGPRTISIRFWTPVAVLRPSYGLMAFQSPVKRAVPSRISYLNAAGVALAGDPFDGSGALPQVVVRSPLTRDVGHRLVRTIRTVFRCAASGAPSGGWFSLNGPHEIRFYPSSGSPVLLLGTDLGCAPFRLYATYMKTRNTQVSTALPEAVDLRFSGMLLLRPQLDKSSPSPGSEKDRSLSGTY